MLDLVWARPQGHAHTIDLPYRLSARALDEPANGRLWHADDGALLGWAALQQWAWQTLDLAMAPEQRDSDLVGEMLAWGIERARQVADAGGRDFRLYVALRDDPALLDLVAQHGFEPARWQIVNLTRPLDVPLPPVEVADGYRLRSSAGRTEAAEHAALHRAAFGSDSMTQAWRARFLTMPWYVGDLDVVVEEHGAARPNVGSLVAFCTGWQSPDGTEAQVEPLGVHPDARQRGLGRLVLLECLHRMQRRGARVAHVQVVDLNDPGRATYDSVGFRPAGETLIMTRVTAPGFGTSYP